MSLNALGSAMACRDAPLGGGLHQGERGLAADLVHQHEGQKRRSDFSGEWVRSLPFLWRGPGLTGRLYPHQQLWLPAVFDARINLLWITSWIAYNPAFRLITDTVIGKCMRMAVNP